MSLKKKKPDLQKGKQYCYTAGCENIKLTYLYEVINGYLFEHDGVKRPLSIIEVKLYIEDI